MNKIEQIIAQAPQLTVMDDGEVRYPVVTSKLDAWETANGPISHRNYDQFCANVECLGEAIVGTPGGHDMIVLCGELLVNGALLRRF